MIKEKKLEILITDDLRHKVYSCEIKSEKSFDVGMVNFDDIITEVNYHLNKNKSLIERGRVYYTISQKELLDSSCKTTVLCEGVKQVSIAGDCKYIKEVIMSLIEKATNINIFAF